MAADTTDSKETPMPLNPSELSDLSDESLARRLKETELRKVMAEALHAERQAEYEALRISETEHTRAWVDARPGNDALILNFSTPVEEASVAAAMDTLDIWSRRWPGTPMEIVFSSPGGSVIDGFALYDYLQLLKARGHELTTTTLGYAASMAGVLLQAGHIRRMGANAHLLIHETSGMAWGRVSDMEDQLKLSESLQRKILAVLAERSTFTARQIKNRWKRKDWWLDAEQAIELGFVDEVL